MYRAPIPEITKSRGMLRGNTIGKPASAMMRVRLMKVASAPNRNSGPAHRGKPARHSHRLIPATPRITPQTAVR